MDIDEAELNISHNFHYFVNVDNAKNLLIKDDTLACIAVNIRSIRKHWDSFISTIISVVKFLDLIVLTEINIQEDEGTNYSIEGFDKLLKCRKNGRGGGGIMFFYREDIEVERLQFDFSYAEILTVKLTTKTEQFLFVSIYRPPSTNINEFNTELDNWLKQDQIKNERNLIMAGDVNICYLNGSYGSTEYLDILYSNGIQNTIDSPTREELLNETITSTCLDHINIRMPKLNHNSFVIECKIADHYITGFTIQLNWKPPTNITTTLNTLNGRRVNELVRNENWWPLLDIQDPDTIYQTLVDRFDEIYKKSQIKIQNTTNHVYNPWINQEIKQLINEKQRIWNMLKRNRNNVEWRNKFKQLRNKLTTVIRQRKRQYYFTRFIDIIKDNRKSWALVNEIINKKKRKTVFDVLRENFKINNDEDTMQLAETFNKKFGDSISTIRSSHQGEKFDIQMYIESENTYKENYVNMNFLPINEMSLIKIINNLNLSSSPGPDKIRPRDIKNNFIFLKLPIIHLINRIIKTGYIPQLMKVTYLRPIYKTGSRSDFNNYRPIGSISILMKILEQHICSQLKIYLETFNVISDSQYGFRCKRSTTDLLERMTEDINRALNDNKYVMAVSLDLTKAFDLIDYNIMLEKLRKIGIGGKLEKLFASYFDSRTVNTSIGKYISIPSQQTYGLVQGSILAPVLFNIYVSDICQLKFKGNILQYADDTIIYTIHTDLNTAIHMMQYNLDTSVKYFFNNYIKLNSNKTKAIVFRTPKKRIYPSDELYCHNHDCLRDNNNCQCEKMHFHNSIKHLGITLDANMKYDTHITYLNRILRMSMYKMYIVKDLVPIPMRRRIYFALVESVIRYGIRMYYTAPEYIIKKLKRTHMRLIRTLFSGIPPQELKIMTFENLAKYVDLTKHYFNEECRLTQNTGYNLRTQSLRIQMPSNSYGKSKLEYRIPKILNDLPIELLNMRSNHSVKAKLKTHFLEVS
jgi:hypothetical protein